MYTKSTSFTEIKVIFKYVQGDNIDLDIHFIFSYLSL